MKKKIVFTEPMTKERLRRYKALKEDIVYQQERMDKLTAELESPSSITISDMPRSKNTTDRMAILVARKIELEEAMRDAMRKEAAEVVEVEKAIQLLKEPREKKVLILRYVEGKEWADISDEINYEISHTYRIHGYALRNIYTETKARIRT